MLAETVRVVASIVLMDELTVTGDLVELVTIFVVVLVVEDDEPPTTVE